MPRVITKRGKLLAGATVLAMLLVAAMALGGIGLFTAAPTSADDDSDGEAPRIFRFVSTSDAGVDSGGVRHRISMNGDGKFTSSHVNGGGTFAHFNQATPGTPKALIASGSWKARKVLSLTTGFGSYGEIDVGIVEMQVDLFPDGGRKIRAVLRLVCNFGPSGITTGEPEGYKLTVPGAGLTFVPLHPEVGLTHLSVPGSR